MFFYMRTFFMAYVKGEGRQQGTLFPVTLDDLVSADRVCRVINAFVGIFADDTDKRN